MKKSEKIILPKELQEKMLEFFLETSIPRMLNERNNYQLEQHNAKS